MLVERFPGASASQGYGLTETNAVGCVIGQDDYLLRPGICRAANGAAGRN